MIYWIKLYVNFKVKNVVSLLLMLMKKQKALVYKINISNRIIIQITIEKIWLKNV